MTREGYYREITSAPGIDLTLDIDLGDASMFAEELNDLSLWVRPLKMTYTNAPVQWSPGRGYLFLQVKEQIIKAMKVTLIKVSMRFQQFNSLGCFILLMKNTSQIFYSAWESLTIP